MRYLTQRSTRQKIMLYLSNLARKREIDVCPAFQPSADGRIFLRRPQRLIGGTEQNEKDGLIDYHKDKFTLRQEH